MWISGFGCCARGSVASQQLMWEFLAVISQRITTLYSADVFTTQLSRVSHLDASEEQRLRHLTLHFNKNQSFVDFRVPFHLHFCTHS